jgi:hypothetical protein
MRKKNQPTSYVLKESIASAAGMMALPMLPSLAYGNVITETVAPTVVPHYDTPRIKFSVIGMNHSHIYGQVEAVTRGGGQLISYYAKEADLVQHLPNAIPMLNLLQAKRRF